jgi:LacI family transcriptional regulator
VTVREGRTTIRDVARLAGVSVATVSRVLNNRPDVAPATREAVLEVVAREGFGPNSSARGLPHGRIGVVAVTAPFIEDRPNYFAAILAGLADALEDADTKLLLLPARRDRAREVRLRDRLKPGSADGAILVMPLESADELVALQSERLPITIIDPRAPLDEGIPCVAAANAAGASAATEHLLELGHRSIAAITGPAGWASTEERRQGYHAALASAGIAPDRRLTETGDWQIESGRGAAARLLDLEEPPTALFAFNDEMAIGAIQAARERGLRIPDDLSVVGFDDVERAFLMTPQLTTVRQPLGEMGRMAVNLLFRLLDKQRIDALRIVLATHLVKRESTAAPRGVHSVRRAPKGPTPPACSA